MVIQSYRDLKVWQAACVLAKEVYVMTADFPKEEIYGLTAQMRRAAVSIPSNLAEGHSRRGARDFASFISIAIGSAAELHTQVLISQDLGFCDEESCRPVLNRLEEVQRMLHGLRSSIKTTESFLANA
jgi:carbamoyl-phosphate synthase large subunit